MKKLLSKDCLGLPEGGCSEGGCQQMHTQVLAKSLDGARPQGLPTDLPLTLSEWEADLPETLYLVSHQVILNAALPITTPSTAMKKKGGEDTQGDQSSYGENEKRNPDDGGVK
jgi:hypothetical protein